MNLPLPTIEEIMAAAGLKREGARMRLQKCRAGLLPRECLMETKGEARSRAAGRTAGKKEDWQGLGNKPRTERLQYIPGPTATELRMSGVQQQEPAAVQPPPPPPPPTPKVPSAKEIAAETGLRLVSAYKRLAQYKAGEIDRSELLAPRKLSGRNRTKTMKTMGRLEKLMAATGLSEDSARERLALYEAGMMDVERLFQKQEEQRHAGN